MIFRVGLAVMAILGSSLALSSCGRGKAVAPNLLLITLDTLRADHLGAYGYSRPTSPNFDAFAQRATLFHDVTCSMPTTLPSHLTIFSGLSPAEHGVMRNGVVAKDDLVTIFDLLGQAGRRTAAIVASGVLEERFLARLGFDEVIDDDLDKHAHQLPGHEITERAMVWLDRHGGEPFALWVHYYDTHEPYAPSSAWTEAFAGGYSGRLENTLSGHWLQALNRRRADRLDPADRQHIVNLYDAEVASLDADLGRLLVGLSELGLEDETVVVIVADHGQAIGEQHRYGHGEWLLEPIIKVPLVVRLPGQEAGRRVEAPVETLDLLPTLCELFGIRRPDDLSGRSLVPALVGTEAALPPVRRTVLRRRYEGFPERRGVAILRGDEKWTYLRDAAGDSFHLGLAHGAGGLDGESFFVEGSRQARQLQAVAMALSAQDGSPEPLSDEVRAMLGSLGYLP